MAERHLGTTDLRLSAVGLGCNNFGIRLDLSAASNVVHAALDAGITVFDTADIYGNRGGSESILGKALGTRRKDVVLITKFGLAMDDEGELKGGSYAYVMTAVEASLKRLKTDWIDLYYLHRPDPTTPIEETLRALDTLVRQGKVRYIGCSNMSAAQVTEAQRISQANGLNRFVTCQDQYSLLSREIEAALVPAMEANGLSLLPYFPLASGMLTGKYAFGAPLPEGTRLSRTRYSERFLNDENFHIVERLREFCAQRDRSLLELAFGWLLSKPLVGCVIAGASTPEQVKNNVAASGWRLDAAEMGKADQLSTKLTAEQREAN
ncbi:MAG TPA: aldo/keto reductase [Bradyrhizobium sp.]|jgi:aryl-alcohol dehydrogenase-like predicted oxidoreductase